MLPRTQSTAAMGSAISKFPMNLQILEPNEHVTITRTFDTPEALKIYVSAHKRAVLKALSTPTAAEKIVHPSAYSSLNPSRTYLIYAPLHTEEGMDVRHNQVTDGAFEEKCQLALERFLKSQGLNVVGCSRGLYKLDNSGEKAKKDIAIEWDGCWTDEVGMYYVLECKHFMSAVFTNYMLYTNRVIEMEGCSRRTLGKDCYFPWCPS